MLAHFPGFDISSAHAQLDEAKISFTNGLGDTLNAAFALAIGAHHKIKDLDAASVGPSLRDCLIFSSAIVQARLRATWRRVYQVYTNELHDLDLLSYYPTRDDVLQFTREVEIAEPRLPPLDEVADLPRDTIEKTDEDLCRLYEAGNFDVVHFAVGQPETRPSGVYMARQRKRKAAQRFVFIDLDYTLFDSSQRVQAAMVAARKCSQGLARLHLEPAAVTEAWSEIYERHQEFRGCGFSDFRQVWSSSDCWSLALAEAEKSRNRVRGTETSSGRIVGQVAHRAREIKSEFPDLCHSLDDSFWKYRFTPFDGIREALESLTALEIQVYLVAEGHSVTQDLKIKYLGLERAIAHERRLFASALPRPFDGKSMAGEFFDDKVEPLQRDEHIATEEIQKKIATELGDVTRALMSRQPGEITPVEKIARLEKELDCLHDDLNVIRQVSRVYRAFRLNLRQLFHAKALLSVLVSPYNPRKFFEDRLETFSDDLLTEEFQRLFTTGQGRLVVVGDRVDSELAPYIEIECPCRLIRLELSTKYVNQPLQGDYMQSIKDIPQLMDALTDSKWWDDKVPRLRVPKITRSLPLGNRDDEVLMKAASQWGNVHHVYANTGNAAREILDRKRVIVG